MYRRAGAQGPLHGVASGVYTRASPASASPTCSRGAPIAPDRPGGLPSSVRAVWGAVLGVLVLVVTFAAGFDDPSSRWELQPRGALLLYVAGVGLFAFSLLAVLRCRFDRCTTSGAMDERFAAREGAFVWSFERVFSETCPASVVRFRIAKDDRRDEEPFDLFVGTTSDATVM